MRKALAPANRLWWSNIVESLSSWKGISMHKRKSRNVSKYQFTLYLFSNVINTKSSKSVIYIKLQAIRVCTRNAWWCHDMEILGALLALCKGNSLVNSSPPGQNGCHFADDNFRCIFVNENFCILIKISLKFAPKGTMENNHALV